MLVDVTEVLNEGRLSDPLALADLLRRKVREKTGCSASVGMGPNPLLARMATRRAKPDGMFLLGQGGYSIDILDVGQFLEQFLDQFPTERRYPGRWLTLYLCHFQESFMALFGDF